MVVSNSMVSIIFQYVKLKYNFLCVGQTKCPSGRGTYGLRSMGACNEPPSELLHHWFPKINNNPKVEEEMDMETAEAMKTVKYLIKTRLQPTIG